MTLRINAQAAQIPLAGESLSPLRGIAPMRRWPHQGRMRGAVSAIGVTLAFAAFAVAGPACAQTVSMTAATPDFGSLVVTTGSSASITINATSGTVTPSSNALIVKRNGAQRVTSVAVNTVNVTCHGSCKGAYKVFVSAVSATGLANPVTLLNIGTVTCVGITCTVASGTISPNATTPLFTFVSNNSDWTIAFPIGATLSFNPATAASHAAAWMYRVQVTQ